MAAADDNDPDFKNWKKSLFGLNRVKRSHSGNDRWPAILKRIPTHGTGLDAALQDLQSWIPNFHGFYSPDTLDPPDLKMSSSLLSEVKKWEICVCCWCQSSLGSQSLPLYICNNYAFHFPPPPLSLEMGETGQFGGIICRAEDLWTILNFQTVGVM